MGIENDLRRRLRHYGLENAFDASVVCKASSELSGGMFEPISFNKGVLKVAVSSSGRGHLLKLRQKEVINQINEKLQTKKVIKLVIIVRD